MALEQELEEVRRALWEAADELARDQPDRRLLAELGLALSGTLGRLVRAVRQARGERAQLWEPCRELWEEVFQVLGDAHDAGATADLGIEEEILDLYILVRRLEVAALLTEAPVRQTAVATGLAQSYVSDLRQAKKGLPSAEVAEQLDRFLADRGLRRDDRTIAAVVSGAQARAAQLREDAVRARRSRREQRGGLPTGGRLELRVQAISDVLRRDEGFLHLSEQYLQLEDRERRAVARLIEDLAEA